MKKRSYHQRKVSCPNRPTQLEIGGEGSPMLSLLPPLKTREISPRYNYTVGRKVKENMKVGAFALGDDPVPARMVKPKIKNSMKTERESKRSTHIAVKSLANIKSMESEQNLGTDTKMQMPPEIVDVDNENKEAGLDRLELTPDEVDPTMTGMNNLAGMANLNMATFDKTLRQLDDSVANSMEATAQLLEDEGRGLNELQEQTRHVLLSKNVEDPHNLGNF